MFGGKTYGCGEGDLAGDDPGGMCVTDVARSFLKVVVVVFSGAGWIFLSSFDSFSRERLRARSFRISHCSEFWCNMVF